MYGLWWIFIGLITITLGLIVWAIIAENNYCDGDAQSLIAVIFGLTAIGFLCGAIFNPISAKADVIEFGYKKEMVEQVIANGKGFENLEISSTVIYMNTWLSRAKANQEAYGNFSKYYNEDLSVLDPIEMP